MRVASVMTRQVVTVVPDASFRVVVGTLIAHGLDALPVIDPAGRPVGVVTETDALAKLEYHGGAARPHLLAGTHARARWHKASGLVAADLMTAPAVTVTQDTSLAVAVRALSASGTCRLCVVDHGGHLLGVLARGDVLRVFLRGDAAIRADLERRAVDPVKGTHRVTVDVTNGIVTLRGSLPLRSTAECVIRSAHAVPGVIAVRDNLRHDVDDLMVMGL
jgi:CBS domain-containing protein